jgi:hypothetical protein
MALTALAAGLLIAPPASANLIYYGTESVNGADGPTKYYQLLPGERVTVGLYLYEIFDPAVETSELVAEGGISGGGVHLEQDPNLLDPNWPDPVDPAGVDALSDFVFDAAFDDANASLLALGGDFQRLTLSFARDANLGSGATVDAGWTPPDMRRIPIGSLTITAGQTVGDVTILGLFNDDPADPLPATLGYDSAAALNVQDYTLMVEVVPEPATMGLLTFAGVAALLGRRRAAAR